MPENIYALLKRILNPFIFGNIIIALCAFSLFLETYLLLGVPLKVDGLSLLVFFATLSLYNLHRLLNYKRIRPEDYGIITGWSAKHRFTILMLAIIGAGGVAFFVFQTTLPVFAVLTALAVTSVLYELPLIRYGKKLHRLRNLWMYKSLMIVLAWSITTALLPAVNSGIPLTDYGVLLIILERVLFIFLIAVCFDARDIAFDKKDELKTIPIRYGMIFTQKLYKFVSILFALVCGVHYFLLEQRIGVGMAMLLSAAVTYFVISRTNPRRSDYYYLFVVDGMLVLQFLLVALLYAF